MILVINYCFVMSYVRLPKRRPLVDKVSKFIEEFSDLTYDGAKIICIVCDRDLMCWDKSDCKRHVNSAQHTNRKTGANLKTEFMFDIIFMLIACNLPFHILDNETFRAFWNKYNPEWKLPSRTRLRNEVPSVREAIEKKITSELQNKKLWLCVDETIDSKKNSVVNVMVRTMEPLKPSCSLLLASKRLQQCTDEAIARAVLNTLEKFQLSRNQLLMFMTDDAATMRSVGRLLKNECGTLLHVTCKLHALHLVAEEIRRSYPNINELISHITAVFRKSKRIREFHRQCPDIPEPPHLVLTRWGTWLKTAFYYAQHFQKIKSVLLQLDPKAATAIKESQAKFQDVQVEADLQTIHRNYSGLLEAIEKLQHPLLSLVESVQIVDAVHTQINALSEAKNNSVIAKFDSVLKRDSDFTVLRQICSNCTSTDSLCNYKDYFNYANITSLDVKQSFSSHKNIFSSHRTSLAETSVETYLILQIFNRYQLACDSDV